MEVDNISDILEQETESFVEKIKEAYESIIAEKDAEIESLKEELEERKGRCCPKGYEADSGVMVVDTSNGDERYSKYKETHPHKEYDNMIAFVRRDKRSYDLYLKKTMGPKKFHEIYSKKGIPVGKTLFDYVNENLEMKYNGYQYTHYYNRFYFKKDVFNEAIKDIKVLIDNFQEKK